MLEDAGHLPLSPRRMDSMVMPLATRRFTVDEYHRMGRAGVFREDDRVELLEGQIVEMSPIGPAHAGCVAAVTGLLSRRGGERVVVWVQNPVDLGARSEPQPDMALLSPRTDGYRTAHPRARDILLVIEVADTSLEHDRDVKLPLYAEAGVPEVWLVNLTEYAVTVYRDPVGERYATVHNARRGESVTSLRLPGVTLRVEDILG
jgi:Uma2 family endonuclease